MATDMPKTRRSFASDPDELKYLADKIKYWLYRRRDPVQALRFTTRFEALLRKNRGKLSGSIMLHEFLALRYDLCDDIRQEIEHREKMVAMIERLHEIGGPIEARYGRQELVDEWTILAALHDDAGRSDRAEMFLEKAQQLAREYGLAFEETAFLEELRQSPGRLPHSAS